MTLLGDTTVAEALIAIVGARHVLADDAQRSHFGTDFSDQPTSMPSLVVSPTSTDDIARIVAVARTHRCAIVGRGGGMSYTRAHVPDRDGVIVIDTGRMKRIDVQAKDRYVIVDVGVTWAELFDAVRPTGMWVPHLGTLSGLHATVGGGLSQQVAGLGTGFLTDYVLGLEVILADGTVMRTGSWAAHGNKPVLREFGPDLNGLFLCDSGALGIKTRAALRLDPMPRGTAFGVYRFDDHLTMVDAMAEVGSLGLATNVIGSDHHANQAMASMPAPPKEMMVEMVKQTMKASTSKWRGARLLVNAGKGKGLSYLANLPNALMIICDSTDTAAAERVLKRVAAPVKKAGGTSQPVALALGMRMSPFNPIQPLMFGPNGESTIPSNAMVPMTDARKLATAVDRIVNERRAELDRLGIAVGNNYLVTRHVFGVEPLITYPATLSDYRLSWTFPDQRSALAAKRGSDEAAAAAFSLRASFIDAFRELGAAHIQIGRTYPLAGALEGTRTWQLLCELKHLLDPDHLINPGVLGIPAP
jgi:FAD/FMN-containing dehydrogenase